MFSANSPKEDLPRLLPTEAKSWVQIHKEDYRGVLLVNSRSRRETPPTYANLLHEKRLDVEPMELLGSTANGPAFILEPLISDVMQTYPECSEMYSRIEQVLENITTLAERMVDSSHWNRRTFDEAGMDTGIAGMRLAQFNVVLYLLDRVSKIRGFCCANLYGSYLSDLPDEMHFVGNSGFTITNEGIAAIEQETALMCNWILQTM